MSDNKTGKRTGARNRRKRRLRRQFMISSVAAVTVFLVSSGLYCNRRWERRGSI